MATWIIIWIVFWFTIMGLPNYLFKKFKITYYENPWKHTLFFVFSIVMLFAVYQNVYDVYFNTFSSYHLLVVCCLFLVYIFVPVACHNEYYTKKELLGYQLPKFFEILFQQFCFLGGLLTFGVSPIMFGLLFFVVHVPAIFLLPKKFALFPIIPSLAGGLVFAYLQSYGISGFLIALSIHLLFWASFHHALTKNLLGIIPIKR